MNMENVLILCARNSARSHMAEALLRRHAGARFHVYSAGLEASEIDPPAARVMHEIGVPLAGHRSKSAREYLGRLAVHHLIVVCERTERECPKLFPGAARQYSWPFPDPVAVLGCDEDRLDAFRRVRDGIESRILEWLDDPAVGLVGVRK
jgi:arsenate reductase